MDNDAKFSMGDIARLSYGGKKKEKAYPGASRGRPGTVGGSK